MFIWCSKFWSRMIFGQPRVSSRPDRETDLSSDPEVPARMPLTQPDEWTRGFGLGKLRGAREHADSGPLMTVEPRPRDRLRTVFGALVTQTALGKPVKPDVRDALRRAAAQHAAEDWDGTALAAMAYLSDRHQDLGARAWLQVMLAGAGRYMEAVELEPVWEPGRPAASAYVMVASAHAMLGQEEAARDFLSLLGKRFINLRAEFVSVWDDTPVGRQLDVLVAQKSAGPALPVFYHLPFCGGTSMISSLKQTVPWAAIIDIGRRFGLYQIERAQALGTDRTAGVRLVHLHHPFPLTVAGRELSFFTVLRDPVSQLSSGYYKRRESPNIVATKDTTSASFAEHADYTIRNAMTNMLARQLVALHPDVAAHFRDHYRVPGSFTTATTEEQMFWFTATSQLTDRDLLRLARETLDDRFHVVGTMSHLAASHLAGAASIGLPVVQQIGHRGRSGQPSDGPGQQLQARLRSANQVDQELFEEYTERFERDHPELITAVEASES